MTPKATDLKAESAGLERKLSVTQVMSFPSPARLWLYTALLLDQTYPQVRALNPAAGKDLGILVKDLFSQLRQMGKK